jgi:hypothetical protein
MSDDTKKPVTFGRRGLLKGLGAAATAAALPTLWLPRNAYAQTAASGTVEHLIYLRLGGGFRFTTAFNGDVAEEFNPFGRSSSRAPGTEWGVSSLLDGASWLEDMDGPARADLGMQRVSAFSNEICVLPCVDHEPFSARADGNHGTGLERFLTGYVGGSTSFLTYLNYGLREKVAREASQGRTILPAFSLGEAGMTLGAGIYAGYRPPVLDGSGFERFSFDPDSSLPDWAVKIGGNLDNRFRDKLHTGVRSGVEAYQQTREATRAYGRIFRDPILRVQATSTDMVDGISNKDLVTMLGDDGTGREAVLALRLFHFGCPAVFLNQGFYDYHSKENDSLPDELDKANRLLSGLRAALKRMQHPSGGSYWDKTLVVLGSEFGRTANGGKFNSAGGSDHSSDLATRWMSMPMMGGIIDSAGLGGRRIGETRASDLKALGAVYTYRSMLKTMMDVLGADLSTIFPADNPIQDLFR